MSPALKTREERDREYRHIVAERARVTKERKRRERLRAEALALLGCEMCGASKEDIRTEQARLRAAFYKRQAARQLRDLPFPTTGQDDPSHGADRLSRPPAPAPPHPPARAGDTFPHKNETPSADTGRGLK